MISSPECHGPPKSVGVEYPAPTNMADSIESKSVSLTVKLVLASDEVHTNYPVLEVIETVKFLDSPIAIVALEEITSSPSREQINFPSKVETPEL